MMPDFMGDHIRLRKLAWSAEALREFLEKTQIQINFLVPWTIEWTGSCLGFSARRRILVPIKHQLGVAVGNTRSGRQDLIPGGLHIVEHKLNELVFGFFLGVCPAAGAVICVYGWRRRGPPRA